MPAAEQQLVETGLAFVRHPQDLTAAAFESLAPVAAFGVRVHGVDETTKAVRAGVVVVHCGGAGDQRADFAALLLQSLLQMQHSAVPQPEFICPPASAAQPKPPMSRLKKISRWIYLLALFQLAGGPLALGIAVLFGKVTVRSVSVAFVRCPAADSGGMTEARQAWDDLEAVLLSALPGSESRHLQIPSHGQQPHNNPKSPLPGKDAGKLALALDDPPPGMTAPPPARRLPCGDWHSPWFSALATGPPGPPPRGLALATA